MMAFSVLLLPACKTADQSGKTISFERHSHRNVLDADRYFQQGQFKTAKLKYAGIVYAKDTDQQEVPHARYQLGLCHYMLGEYSQALKTLTVFIEQYPDASAVNKAKEIIDLCKSRVDQKNQELADRRNELLKQIQHVEELAAREPDNADHHFKLADLYWASGRFRKSVAQYERAVSLNPEYLQADTLRNRVRIDPSGDFTLREPLLDMIEGEGPVRVVNTKLDRVQRSDWLGEYEILRVSGAVENRGLWDVRNVQVEVSIYDFFDTIQDTRTVSIGTVRAGGKRNFSVLLDQFSGLAVDIRKFTTQVFYEEFEKPAGLKAE